MAPFGPSIELVMQPVVHLRKHIAGDHVAVKLTNVIFPSRPELNQGVRVWVSGLPHKTVLRTLVVLNPQSFAPDAGTVWLKFIKLGGQGRSPGRNGQLGADKQWRLQSDE